MLAGIFPPENIDAIIGTLNYAMDSYVQAAELKATLEEPWMWAKYHRAN